MDILETFRDKLGLTTDIAKQFADILDRAQAAGVSVRWAAHSQGGAIFASAVSHYMSQNPGGSLSYMSVAVVNGANNNWVSGRIFASAGMRHSFYNNSFDLVPNVIGLNGGLFSLPASILAAPLQLTPFSPHGAPTCEGC